MNTADLPSARYHHTLADWVLLVIPLGFIALVVWTLIGPVRTLEPRVAAYRVTTPTVPAGGTLIYQVDACKYTAAPALVFRQLVRADGQITSLGATYTNLPVGCQRSLSTLALPETIAPGRYYLAISLDYQVNGFRNITVTTRTEAFTVTPKAAQP